MKTSTTQAKTNKAIKYVAVALIWITIWEIISLIINEEVLFVPPHKVFLTMISLFGTLGFWKTVAASLIRVVGGFAIGYVFASVLALLSYRFDFFRMFVSPVISLVKATPVASFIILALMWTGKNFVPVLICILMVTPIVWSNVLEGLKSVDKNLLEMADIYKLSGVAKLKKIYLPTLIPYNAAALGSGLGLCWKAGIAAEVICRTLPSIGNSIWETKFYIKTDEMFAWTATVVLLSVIFDILLKRLSKRLTKAMDTEENQ